MQIAKDKVVSLEVRLSDVHGNLIQQSAQAVQYLHGGYEGIFPLVEAAAGEIERGYADDDAAGPLITVVQ